MSKIINLGQMWNMADKVKEIQIVALFKGGHDTLGTELMNSLTDKNFVCNRLVELHVFFVLRVHRLGKLAE